MTIFKMPAANAKVTSHYNPTRKHPVTGKIQKHAGVDLINTKIAKAPILASAAGVVRLVKTTTSGYGKHIIITHNAIGQIYETVYAHLDSFSVKEGQTVRQGQKIGVMGNTGIGTGVHLHFELHRGRYNYGNGTYPTSFDPWPWINPFKMHISKAGLDLIKKWEGFYADAYLCPAKVWTIGYGLTKWPNGSAVKKGDKITQAEALALLEQQVNEHASAIFNYVKIDLTQTKFDALASFCYNLGKHILGKDPALTRYINAKDWANVTRVMQLYNKASGKTLKGLVDRRKEEVELFNSKLIIKKDEVDKLEFSEATTKNVVRDELQQAVNKKMINNSWLDKFDKGTMTNGDYAGLKLIIAQRSTTKK